MLESRRGTAKARGKKPYQLTVTSFAPCGIFPSSVAENQVLLIDRSLNEIRLPFPTAMISFNSLPLKCCLPILPNLILSRKPVTLKKKG
jgi:hypothetical protein